MQQNILVNAAINYSERSTNYYKFSSKLKKNSNKLPGMSLNQ
jgi:hypothetical protein